MIVFVGLGWAFSRLDNGQGLKITANILSKLSSIPMGGKLGFDLDQYVTDKSLKGLFSIVAVEEEKNPPGPGRKDNGAASESIRKSLKTANPTFQQQRGI